jgi:mxaJ protein
VVLLTAKTAEARTLRICADPNNLPFSNQRGEGFENKIAELIASELRADLTYTWWVQRRGFIRNTLNSGLCDLIPGTAFGVDDVRQTAPYYRSSYVFVTRVEGPQLISLDDPNLRTLKIGVQLAADSGINPPPVLALARRGIVDNVRGYSVYGDYREPNPVADIVAAVARGDLDVAIVWGPLAGYFAGLQKVKLQLAPVQPEVDGPYLPMVFDVAMGVRKEDTALREEVNAALFRLRPKINSILAEYGVPRLDREQHAGGGDNAQKQ